MRVPILIIPKKLQIIKKQFKKKASLINSCLLFLKIISLLVKGQFLMAVFLKTTLRFPQNKWSHLD